MAYTGLNTIQLRNALLENEITKPFFSGIFPMDQLKNISAPPKLILVNTDPSYLPGKHWLLFFRTKDRMEMFDSLGQELHEMNPAVQTFAHRFNEYVKYVSQRVQPLNTALCGHYCLYYAYLRCKGDSMNEIVSRMPNPNWIAEYVPLLFDIPGIISDCQTCESVI